MVSPAKARRIRTLDAEGFARLVWDSNRIWTKAGRLLHGVGQEAMDQKLCVVPRIAEELVPGVAVNDLVGTLEDMRRAWSNPQRVAFWGRHETVEPETALKWRTWRIEEWLREDSIHELLLLDAEQEAKAREFLKETGKRNLLKHGDQSTAPRVPDVQILCQAAALGEKVVMTENFRSINHIGVNAWARELKRRGEFQGLRLIERPSRVLETWCEDHPGWMLRCVMAAAWPDDGLGTTLEVENATRTFASNMGEHELAPLGVHALSELEMESDIASVVEAVRRGMPSAAHEAEARSPNGTHGSRRNWRETAPGKPKDPAQGWRLQCDKAWFTILWREKDGTETEVEKVPTTNRKRIIEALTSRKIEVEGLPKHGGNAGGGFAAALNATINEELARQQSRSR